MARSFLSMHSINGLSVTVKVHVYHDKYVSIVRWPSCSYIFF